MIKIILVDDHLLVRNGIKMLLYTHSEIEVIADMENGHDVLSYLSSNNVCDILISDIDMPRMNGLDLAKQIQMNYPSIKVIFLSMLNEQKQLLQAFDFGAHGYLIKNINYDELLFAITHIHKGGKYICDQLSQQLLEQLNNQPNFVDKVGETILHLEMSERELEVLYLISEGLTNIEIAEKLFLSKRTVEGHRQNLIDKTGTKNSASLIKYAVLNGLVT